jgi:hypothetical protein
MKGVNNWEHIIESALQPGVFIAYNGTWDLVESLEKVQERIEELIQSGEAAKAVMLY